MTDKTKKPKTAAPAGLPNNVVNLRERRSDRRVADKAKAQFLNIQHEGRNLSEQEYKDYIMVLLADLVVLVLKAGFYREPEKALKHGIEFLAKRYGPG